MDKTSGIATLVGVDTTPGLWTAQAGIAFNSSDTLYLKDSTDLYLVDTTSAPVINPVLLSPVPLVGGSPHNMLAFDVYDTLFTAERFVPGGADLMTLALDGTLTSVGLTGVPTLAGLAFDGMLNYGPDCSLAVPSLSVLWPTNHAMIWVDILGVTDPEDDPVSIIIDAIMQDEPVNGRGDGNTAPDASGVGTSVAMLRAERSNRGNGRVYEISFTASDGEGGSCSGTVEVGVRRDQGKNGGPAVNDGATFDSTGS